MGKTRHAKERRRLARAADPSAHLAKMLDRPVPQTEAEIEALLDAAEEEIAHTYEAVDQVADFVDALRGVAPEPLPKL